MMFVFGLILTILRAQTRKFGEKGGKNVQKSDEKVHKKYTFVRKKHKNIPIFDILSFETCAFVRAKGAYLVKRETYFVGCFLTGLLATSGTS